MSNQLTHFQKSHSHFPALSNPTPIRPIPEQVHKNSTKLAPPDKWLSTDTLTIHRNENPPKQATHRPFPLTHPHPQQTFNPATPLSANMTPILPVIQAQSVLFPPRIPETCQAESPQTMMQQLRKQFDITQTLITRLSRMIMSNSVDTSPSILSQNLFDLIAELPRNDPLPLLTTPSRTTLQNQVYPTHHRYWFPQNFLGHTGNLSKTPPTSPFYSSHTPKTY